MIIGIDLGGMSAKGACLEGGKLFGRSTVKTSAKESFSETVRRLAALARTCGGKKFEEAEAIGIGSPGVIDGETGTIVEWTNFGWKNAPLKQLLEEQTGKQVFLLNDANAAALGEATFGAGKNFESSVLITLGTGVGGGIILDGKLFEGNKGAGGEIGHMVIREGGRRCNCGRRGCLECYVSVRALISDLKRAQRGESGEILRQIAQERGCVDGKTLFLALDRGDGAAQNIFRRYIASLGEGILNLANLLRPQAVLIGGGISAQGEKLLSPLREYVEERLYLRNFAPMEILAASLQNDAGIYGAAEFARRKRNGGT